MHIRVDFVEACVCRLFRFVKVWTYHGTELEVWSFWWLEVVCWYFSVYCAQSECAVSECRQRAHTVVEASIYRLDTTYSFCQFSSSIIGWSRLFCMIGSRISSMSWGSLLNSNQRVRDIEGILYCRSGVWYECGGPMLMMISELLG